MGLVEAAPGLGAFRVSYASCAAVAGLGQRMSAPVLVAPLAAPPLLAQQARTHVARAKVVLFVADDLGLECVAANGGTGYKTPNLD